MCLYIEEGSLCKDLMDDCEVIERVVVSTNVSIGKVDDVEMKIKGKDELSCLLVSKGAFRFLKTNTDVNYGFVGFNA